MNEIDLVLARLPGEESFRSNVYDDKTGKPLVLASGGEPTVGFGCRVRQWSRAFSFKVLGLQVQEVAAELAKYSWYGPLNAPRKSVVLDIAFNAGVNGLLHYPHMLAALSESNWQVASSNCTDKDPVIDSSRYAPLRKILLTGEV